MKSFKDFNIKPELNSFIGDKVKIDRIINTEIVVHDYKVSPSSQRENTNCLTLQIERNGIMHVVFTGSTVLMQMIEKVPKGDFPFKTTIIKENEYFEFT